MHAVQHSDLVGTMHTLTELDRHSTECRIPGPGRRSPAAGLQLPTPHYQMRRHAARPIQIDCNWTGMQHLLGRELTAMTASYLSKPFWME